MSLQLAIAMSLQVAGSDVSACMNVMREFVTNEVAFGIIHGTHDKLLAADQEYAKATGDYAGVLRRLHQIKESDDGFQTTADRIVTMLTALQCPLPDHMVSPLTYENDSLPCTAPADEANKQRYCNVVEKTMRLYRQRLTRRGVRK